jgi:hypothetical protein
MAPVTKNELKLVDELELMLERVKGTGVVIIQTNLGDIQVELFCQQVSLNILLLFILLII